MRNFSVGLTVFLLVLASSAYAQTPSITSVANAATPATAAGAIAPGMLTVINGTNLGDLIHNCLSSGSAPTSCNGTTVLVNGSAAPVVYSSSAAVEFQAPYTLTGSAATLQVTVKTSGGTTLQSNLVNVSVAPTAPALYSKDGTGVGTGYYIDNTSGGFGSVPSGLVLPGDSILLIGNGFGVTNPTVTAGSPAPSPAAAIVASVTLTINGQTVPATATLEPATVTGNSPGFDQVTFTVPSTLTVPAGQSEKDYAMTVTVGGVQSQSVNLRVATPPPTIASISPSPVPLSTTAQTVQVNGTGFQSGLAVHVLGPPGASTLSGSSVTYVSSTQITIQLVTGSTAGTWAMWIVNPDSSQTSSFTFTASGTGPTPTITSVYTIYTGKSIIAQNDWLEIHGTNLATPGTYTTWNDWNWDFTSSLPTTHGSVSATVNGKTAVLYFVSPTQINVLSPLDNSTGSVTVQVNTPYGQTSAMTVTEQQTAPAFLLTYINNDATGVPYVAARHLDATYSLLGPTALSSPGYTFTPAKPGDTVLLYLTGLGQLNPAITDQLKNVGLLLPYTPTVTIGGLSAQVIDATLAAPGLYQFKVVVPASAPNGDLPLLATYNGASTQSSVYITVQK